jgi:hypothetical protein
MLARYRDPQSKVMSGKEARDTQLYNCEPQYTITAIVGAMPFHKTETNYILVGCILHSSSQQATTPIYTAGKC